MADNKRQHFVPRYILKKFSSDENAKRINLLHIPTERIVRGASLREQCYKDYFYGNDTSLEKEISKIEGAHSQIVDDLIAEKENSSIGFADLPLFLAMQSARTQLAEKDQNDMANELYQRYFSGLGTEDFSSRFKFEYENGAVFSLALSMHIFPALYDLKQILLENVSGDPFVISDNPVVKTNWFCRVNYPNNAGLGYSNSGLQLFMPISPKFGVFLFDDSVYKIKSESFVFPVSKKSDVFKFNELQYMNADKCLYFGGDVDEDVIFRLGQGGKRRATRFRQIVASQKDGNFAPYDAADMTASGGESELIIQEGVPLAADIRFSGFGMKLLKKYFDDGSLAAPLRDQVWDGIVQEFSWKIFHEGAAPEEFLQFVERHPLKSHLGQKIKKRIFQN